MPNKYFLGAYIQELKKHHTRKVIRVCEGNYDETPFNRVGITVTELLFEEGTFPPQQIIDEWLEIVEDYFHTFPGQPLAVHCHSGLGRSPVLIAIALIEYDMKPQEAIHFLKSKRRGLFNKYQLERLNKYQSKNKLRRLSTTA